MAEGILRHKARERGLAIHTDSAGTSNYHVGEAPDTRAQAAMRRKGIDISDLRARQFHAADYQRFDLILAMDASNLENMLALAPDAQLAKKARLVMDHAPEHPLRDVPDPYFGGDEGFDAVYQMLSKACDRILDELAQAQR